MTSHRLAQPARNFSFKAVSFFLVYGSFLYKLRMYPCILFMQFAVLQYVVTTKNFNKYIVYLLFCADRLYNYNFFTFTFQKRELFLVLCHAEMTN